MKPLPILLFSLFLCLISHGKEWRNTDGSKSFTADYVAIEGSQVTLKRPDGREVTFALSKLHSDDQLWIKKHTTRKLEGSAFDTLNFGDNKEQVQNKLNQSKIVTSSLDEKLLGRTGLNGIYKTKNEIGGRQCELYFSWSKANLLREVSLQTQPASLQDYDSLKETWSALVDLLKILHGAPTHTLPFPKSKELGDGQILGTHLWRTESGHSVLLGSARDHESYKVVVRFTTEPITIIETAGTSVPSGPIFPD